MALVIVVAAACEAPIQPTTLIGRRAHGPLPATWPWLGDDVVRPAAPAVFDGRLELLGARLEDGGARGTSWWLVVGDLAGRLKPELVVGVGAGRHASPLVAALHPLEWRPGDVVEAPFTVPAGAGGEVGLGVQDAGRPWPGSAGELVPIGRRATADVVGPVARRRRGEIVVDGALDEADWAAATALPLQPWKAGAPLGQATTLRFLWDPEHLYLAFDVDDDDPHSPYTRRDEPLYESEALELFIDADDDRDVYVELQASPTNVHFDAAFAGGPRKGMDVGWNAPFLTATAPRPGGYTQEWQIPVAALKDIPAGEPRPDARWPINAFRLERRRSGDRVTATEAAALSPPERSDFHALERFVPLRFVE